MEPDWPPQFNVLQIPFGRQCRSSCQPEPMFASKKRVPKLTLMIGYEKVVLVGSIPEKDPAMPSQEDVESRVPAGNIEETCCCGGCCTYTCGAITIGVLELLCGVLMVMSAINSFVQTEDATSLGLSLPAPIISVFCATLIFYVVWCDGNPNALWGYIIMEVVKLLFALVVMILQIIAVIEEFGKEEIKNQAILGAAGVGTCVFIFVIGGFFIYVIYKCMQYLKACQAAPCGTAGSELMTS
uniref:MARVEL domain-containing protein n=1 Tax=Steinernema glaseri TaxID=37863 RepID=A0A1I8A161_9BILA